MRKAKTQNLTDLDRVFADLVKKMQTNKNKKAIKALMTATPEQLNEAARQYRMSEEAMYRARKAQGIVAKHKKNRAKSVADELIAERRQESKCER